MSKRSNGVYYTAGNPFDNPAFTSWAKKAKLPSNRILEPFAGANSLITTLKTMGWCQQWKSFDIAPGAAGVEARDTLAHFPKGYSVCVTNPPWLAKNSASARGLSFPHTPYDDLYKVALQQCLKHCQWVAALVPESFIRADVFQERLSHFISLTGKMFSDTGHPVGLALFQAEKKQDVMIWQNGIKLGTLVSLKRKKPQARTRAITVKFNDPAGNVGLIALDNTLAPSIRFCAVSELADYKVKTSGRHITKITVGGKIRITEWNHCLNTFRKKTRDVLLTCYKGIRKDGWYRRRLDWGMARRIIEGCSS